MVIEMFARSETLHEIKYINYISDGDTKTFKALLDSKSYEDELPIRKKECVRHVKKRMSFRAAKKKDKGLGDKDSEKLTDVLINDLSTYYGLVIVRNSNSVNAMKDAIWATFYHKCLTDENFITR